MSEVCTKCFQRHDVFTSCNSNETYTYQAGNEGRVSFPTNVGAILLGLTPLTALFLDFVLPLPSSIFVATFLLLLAMLLSSIIWVLIFYQGVKTPDLFFKNLHNFIFTPNLAKVFNIHSQWTSLGTWVSLVSASLLLQTVLFTPGNAAYVSNRIADEIEAIAFFTDRVDVSCPPTIIFAVSQSITCEIETGLLLTVPFRVKIAPLLGTVEANYSLL